MFEQKDVADCWKRIGIDDAQKLSQAIDEVYSNKKRLGLNVYVGEWNKKNICICLNKDEKVISAFPSTIGDAEYLKIENEVKTLYKGFGIDIEEVPLEIISTFIGIDIMNNKEIFLNNEFEKIESHLFPFSANQEIIVISTSQGGIAIGINAVKEIIEKIK